MSTVIYTSELNALTEIICGPQTQFPSTDICRWCCVCYQQHQTFKEVGLPHFMWLTVLCWCGVWLTYKISSDPEFIVELLRVYLELIKRRRKPTNCDSGNGISSVFVESCDVTEFLGMASQPGQQAAGAPPVEAPCWGSHPTMGNFPLQAGWGGVIETHFLALFLADKMTTWARFLLFI